MAPEFIRSEHLVRMDDPQAVFEEVKIVILLMFPQFDFTPVQKVLADIIKLFKGKYPGYRKCNTHYHDLKHTTDCLLVMTRLIHGAFINGIVLPEREVTLGLISALMHDTGYIQKVDEAKGTGGKYTMVHIERSHDFMEQYFRDNGLPLEDLEFCHNCLRCTGLNVKIKEVPFISRNNELLGKILGAADLLGQMADRTYLERLPFLYHEFKEGGVPGFIDELDLLKKTPGFWEFSKKRFATELGQVDRFLKDHFRVRWGIDRDLDREAIERNINYLKFILENHPTDYQKFLKRDGLMHILLEMRTMKK